ncbi:PilZ domain-containing protein [Myxococcota bacterium]
MTRSTTPLMTRSTTPSTPRLDPFLNINHQKSEMKPPEDPRQHPRRVVSWNAQWSSQDEENLGRICDVSVGGIFLQPIGHAPTLVPGAEVLLRIQIPGQDQIDMKVGRVCWRGYKNSYGCVGVGIEFDGPIDPYPVDAPVCRAPHGHPAEPLSRPPMSGPDPV